MEGIFEGAKLGAGEEENTKEEQSEGIAFFHKSGAVEFFALAGYRLKCPVNTPGHAIESWSLLKNIAQVVCNNEQTLFIAYSIETRMKVNNLLCEVTYFLAVLLSMTYTAPST